MYKKKQDEIIMQIQTNMLKSEQLDKMMKQTSNYVYPKAELHKIQAKDFTMSDKVDKNNSSFILDDTSKEFLEEEISEMRPYSQSSIQKPQSSLKI